jgi:O-antigen/teichoic acid export membrane protein
LGRAKDEQLSSGPPPLLKNIAFNVGARGVLIILSIAITPVLVHRLGTEQYGIYALATVLGSGLTNVFALGLIPGIVAMLSRSLGQRNDAETQKVIGTSMTLFAFIGVVGAVALALAVPYLVHDVLRIPAGLQGTAATALWISAVGLGLNVVFAVFNAIPYALQRYDIIASRIVGLALLSMAATVVYVLVYANLTGVMVIQVIAGVAGLVVYYAVSTRHLPNIRFLPGFDRPTFVRLARFTAFKSVGDIALTFGSRFDQFAIGSLINVGAVGIYAVPATACQRILQLLGEVAAPMFPRMSSVETDDQRRAVLVRGTRLVALPAAFIFMTLIVLAEPILRIWIGGHQGVVVANEASSSMRLLAAAMFLQAVVVVAGLYCEAIQRPVVNNSFTVLGAIVQIPVILFLVPRLGISGAALGVLIASIIQTVPFLIFMVGRVAHVPILDLVRNGLAGSVVSSIPAGVVGFLLVGHTPNFPSLVAVLAVTGVAYVAAAAATGALRASDLQQVQSIVPLPLGSLPGYRSLSRWLRP